MTTSKNLTIHGAFGSGPSMSIPHMEKGQGELKLWRLLEGVHGMFAKLLASSGPPSEVEGVGPECWPIVFSTYHFGCKGGSLGMEAADPFIKFSYDIVCLLPV